jgi:hypothetical protein
MHAIFLSLRCWLISRIGHIISATDAASHLRAVVRNVVLIQPGSE